MSEHTPGPWRADGTVIYAGRHNLNLAELEPSDYIRRAEQEANARLIAAAPDMLRALLDIRDSSAYCAASKARAAMAIDKATKP
jgi:hypothetical protein